MGLSIRGYAKHRGCTHRAVQKALATGRIVAGADGTIDPAAADRMWRDTTAPHAPAADGGYFAPGRDENAPPRPDGPPVVEAGAFQRARTAKMILEAKREAFELRVREGEVLERALVVREAFSFASMVREAWQAWPSRIGPELAATLGIYPVLLTTVLEDEVRRHLELLADRMIRLPDRPAAAQAE
jgi:hypothetical protein